MRFREAFARGNHWRHPPRADEMDICLHAERRSRRAVLEDWRNLPDGTMIAQGGEPRLVLSGKVFAWSASGYREDHPEPGYFHLLTPPSIVAALSAGYRAGLHSSALALRREAERERRD
jgi:hypothetical protein